MLAPAQVGERSGQVFYVWFSVFNLFATMLFWALMADRFSLAQSKRLFGVIAVGGTLGAIFGPWLASVLAKPLGTPALLLVAAGLPGAGGGRGGVAGAGCAPTATPAQQATRLAPPSARSSAAAPGRDCARCSPRPTCSASAAYVLILAVMATFLYFTRLQMVAALGDDLDVRTTMFARIDMVTQAATLLLQALVTGQLMKRLGVAVTLALLPLTAALGFLGLAIAGSLAVLVAFEAAFRAVQRGIMRPARETLFTVVSRADRYKAKAFIDTFVYRAGDVVGAQTEGLLGAPRHGAGGARVVRGAAGDGVDGARRVAGARAQRMAATARARAPRAEPTEGDDGGDDTIARGC